MPSTITHAIFSKDVYKKLNKNCKKNIDLERLQIFSQGPDIYYFYHFLLGTKAKKIYDIGDMLHTKKIDIYFYNILNYINKNNLYNNTIIKTYLFGIICHYCLDTTTHPFIVYNTGIFEKDKKETFKYNALHQKYEYLIDSYMIENKMNINCYKYKMYKILNENINDKELKNLINNTNKKTYNLDNTFKYYNSSLKYMYLFFKLFNYDRYGLKKKVYKIIDKFTSKKTIKLEELSYHVRKEDYLKCLNLNKDIWNHPAFKDEIYNHSFNELYNLSIDKCVNLLNNINKMLTKKQLNKKEIFKSFNSSYISGKDYKEDLTFIYFKF